MKTKVLLIIGIIINSFIWINSLMPASISSSHSGLIVNILYPSFKKLNELDKFSKIIIKLTLFNEFMLLRIIFSLYYLNKGINKYYLVTIIHGIIVAIIDETIQLFIPGRAGLITDVLIDTLGLIIGVIIILYYKNRGDLKNTCVKLN